MSLFNLIYTSADTYNMHVFPKNDEQFKLGNGKTFLKGHAQTKIVTQEENKL